MDALVFIGRDLFPDTRGFYFQDAASYRAGLRADQSDAVDIHCQAAGQVRVMDFEHALDRLLYCSLLRADNGHEP